jgi:hypothetical protein
MTSMVSFSNRSMTQTHKKQQRQIDPDFKGRQQVDTINSVISIGLFVYILLGIYLLLGLESVIS